MSQGGAAPGHAAAPEVPSESQPPATEQQSQPRKPAGRRALFGGGAAAEGEGAAGATHPPAPAAAESQDAQSSGTAPAAAPATTAKALVNIHKQTLKEAGIEVSASEIQKNRLLSLSKSLPKEAKGARAAAGAKSAVPLVRLGPSGLNASVLTSVASAWRNSELVKLRIVSRANKYMPYITQVCAALEQRTGGLVVWRAGGSIWLFRGAGYDAASPSGRPGLPHTRARVTPRVWPPARPTAERQSGWLGSEGEAPGRGSWQAAAPLIRAAAAYLRGPAVGAKRLLVALLLTAAFARWHGAGDASARELVAALAQVGAPSRSS
eukprot:XP_001692777.1 predicted protein [Chlamydomonas reinhardtii]